MTYTEETMKGTWCTGKPIRGALFTVVQRNLAQNKIDIVDSLNYMRRFHWMYRAAREINDRVCMVSVQCILIPCSTAADWGRLGCIARYSRSTQAMQQRTHGWKCTCTCPQ
ncbi:hypothetical protein F5J12DRAFT_853397 [Pisolithus orientalis]|uniref:uncharacterized protein n=1 Tax=Pisolithus orientalis TaxID=936130 RepID=UPI002224845A|nr:uncharacterized protein F5J12DRAFT_853397 [Pisolithus orientalis]KAI5996622.1 hypothetical protein F5J12DRAFT_853397 [Pisolithus orientalis]